MAVTFHLARKGPRRCFATTKPCVLGGESGQENHFSSLEEAQEAFKQLQEERKLFQGRGKGKGEAASSSPALQEGPSAPQSKEERAAARADEAGEACGDLDDFFDLADTTRYGSAQKLLAEATDEEWRVFMERLRSLRRPS